MAEKGGTSHGGLTEKLSPFFHAKKQEVNAYDEPGPGGERVPQRKREVGPPEELQGRQGLLPDRKSVV